MLQLLKEFYMIIKLAAFTSKVTGFVPKTIERLGLTNFSKKLASNPELANKIKNASLVGTIAAGDGVIKMVNRNPGESRTKAFGKGALEGAFAGSLIAGADQGVDSLASHGAKKLNFFKR
jgi:hypothetical protein